MKAIGYQQSLAITHPQALVDINVPKPSPTGKDILVRVEAISVNPVDTKIRLNSAPENGEYKILGWDAAGVIEAVGDEVSSLQVGDKVWYAGAIDRTGCNAEYHLVDERIVSTMPTSLSFTQAAALPLTAITAWELLFDRLGLNANSTGELLIIGAAGGVGSMMIQLAKQLTKLTVIATASRPETQAWVRTLGADHVLDHRQPLVDELHTLGLSQVPYITSLTHTDHHLDAILEMIAPQGKFGLIDDPTTLNIMPLKRKSVSVHWELMFTRSLFQTHDMAAQQQLLTKVAAMVDKGTIQSTLCHDFGHISATQLRKAHALLESSTSHGKIVLTGFE